MAAAAGAGGRAEPRVLGEPLGFPWLSGFFSRADPSGKAITNTLFQTHLDHRLRTRLPPAPGKDAPPDVRAAYDAARDAVLTDFYRDWLAANKARQARWVWEWWRDIRHEVWDGLKRGLRWR